MNSRAFNSFAIFGAMRSGSNLLERYLNQYEQLVCHGELFQKAFVNKPGMQEYLGVTKQERNQNPTKLLEAVLREDPNKTPGYRIFQDHDTRVIDIALKDPACAKIILTRDPIESYVSLKIARDTNQWLISDPAHRKTSSIRFDMKEYNAYKKERSAFYSKVYKALEQSGQPWFEIDYSALNQLEAINRLVRFLGVDEQKQSLEQSIKRQNPAVLSEKITNYQEVRVVLGLPKGKQARPITIVPAKESGTALSRVFFSDTQSLAFAPVPAVHVAEVKDWMHFVGASKPENGFTDKALANWKQKHPEPLVFSVVSHPLVRAYSAFTNKIFATSAGSYDKIRHQLETRFSLLLPKGDIQPDSLLTELKKQGYGVQEHRTSFKQFLVFVAGNLASNTNIRQDGHWQHQSEVIRRYRVLMPVHHVLKAETLKADLCYLENRMALKPHFSGKEPQPQMMTFALADVYDAELEALCRAAYEPDYKAFGYEDLSRL